MARRTEVTLCSPEDAAAFFPTAPSSPHSYFNSAAVIPAFAKHGNFSGTTAYCVLREETPSGSDLILKAKKPNTPARKKKKRGGGEAQRLSAAAIFCNPAVYFTWSPTVYIPLPFNTGMELWRSLQHHLQHSKETRNTLILRAHCGTEPRKTTAPKKRKNSSPCAKEPEHMCMSSKMECAKGAGNKLWVSYSAFSLL